jgi:hypothetical protein
MSGNPRAQAVNTRVAVCLVGSLVLFAMLFIVTLGARTRQSIVSNHSPSTATSTSQ